MIIIGITNRNSCSDFFEQIRKIAKSQINYLVIREKDLGNEKLLNLAIKIKEILEDTNIKIIINSNIKIAKQINAEGIQLPFKDFVEIRNKITEKKIEKFKETGDGFGSCGNNHRIYNIVGVSIHSFEEGIRAYKLGADYVIYGHVFKTDCKKGLPPRGIEEIKELSRRISIPIIGIGGIDKNNFREVLNAGGSGVAIMSGLMKSENPKKLVEEIFK